MKSPVRRLIFLTLFAALNLTLSIAAMAQQTIYFGTYTNGTSHGIYRASFDPATGHLGEPELAAQAKDPSFLAFSPDGTRLFAALEMPKQLGAWSVGGDGQLTALNVVPSGGADPCHVWVDATGRTLLYANYSGGSFGAYRILPDGSLGARSYFFQATGSGPNKGRQEGPHLHSAYTDPSNRFVYTMNLGTDQVSAYHFDAATGSLTPADPPFASVPPGAGARHLAFSAAGYVYVCNEMGISVTVFKRDAASGALTPVETVSNVPEGTDTKGFTTAEIALSPGGKFLYVSNRGRDTITLFYVTEDGKLTRIEETPAPAGPRGMALSPDGKWVVVAGQGANRVDVLRVDPNTGQLTATGQSIKLDSPVSVLWAPERK